MNSISLVGRVGGDPEVRYLDSGKVVAKLSLAVRRAYSRGEVDTDWFSLEIWGKTAEVAANYVRKGSQISVTGRIEFVRFEGKDGQQREKTIVKVNDLGLLDPKPSQQEQPPQSPQQPQYQQQPPQQHQYQQSQPQYQSQPQSQPQYRNDEF